MSSEKILVTGATGLFGGTTLEHLRSAGREVIGTTRDTDSELAQRLGLKRLDTSNFSETVRFVSTNLPKTILHFSGVAKPKEIESNPAQSRVANVDSVMNLINAILTARDKNPGYDPVIVIAGSVEQFGDPSFKDQVFSEDSERKPVNLYGSQKEEMSLMALNLFHTFNIKGYVMIQGQTTGSSPSGEISQGKGYLITDIASQIVGLERSGVKEGEIVTGEISQKRNIMNINDAVEAYLAVAEKRPEVGEYIVCADQSIPLTEVLQFMIKSSTIKLKHTIDSSRGFGKPVDRFYSHKKLTKATGWKPKATPEQTFVEVLEHQRKQWGKINK